MIPGGPGPPRPWSSQAPFCPSADLSRTHLSNRLRPTMQPGDQKIRKRIPPPLSSPPPSLSQPRSSATRPSLHTFTTTRPQLLRQGGHPRVLAGLGRDAGDKRTGHTPVENQPWETRGPRKGGAPRGQSLGARAQRVRTSQPKARGRAGAPRPGPSGPPPRRARARASTGCGPSAPAQLAARLTDASSPPAAASGVFVYIRARRPALRRRVYHRLAIIFTHACGSAGSWFGRGTLAFLSAGAASPLPPGVYLLYPVSGTGWVLQQSVPPPRRSRFASLSPGEWNYLFIYVPRLVLARRSRGRRGRRKEGRRGC